MAWFAWLNSHQWGHAKVLADWLLIVGLLIRWFKFGTFWMTLYFYNLISWLFSKIRLMFYTAAERMVPCLKLTCVKTNQISKCIINCASTKNCSFSFQTGFHQRKQQSPSFVLHSCQSFQITRILCWRQRSFPEVFILFIYFNLSSKYLKILFHFCSECMTRGWSMKRM